MQKILFVSVILLLCGTLFFGCQKKAAQEAGQLGDAPVTIQFWNHWTGPDGETLVAVVNEFNKANPYKITVEMDIVDSQQLVQKLNTSFSAGEAAQFLLQAMGNRFRYQEYFVPINDIWENTSLRKEDFLQGHLKAGSVGDDLYIIPFQYSAQYLYWNKDLFQKAGLDPNKPPMNWQEWTSIAEKITNPASNVYGSGVFYTPTMQTSGLMSYAGGSGIIEPSPGKYKANFVGNKDYRDYLLWAKDLFDRGLNPREENMNPIFMAGQLGMTISNASLAPGADRSSVNFGMTKFFGMEPKGTVLGFVTTTSIKSEVERLAVQKFIEYWFKGLDGSDLPKTGAGRWAFDIGFPASYIPLINNPLYQQNQRLMAVNPAEPDVFYDTMVPLTFHGDINSVISALCQEVIFSRATGAALNGVIDTALANANRDAEAVIIQYHGEAALIK